MPERGRILIGGADVTPAPPAARDVAFVFQQYSLYPHYTVFENLAFPLRAPGRSWPAAQIRARVEEIARLLRIEGKLGNRATQLSGGEMQRVAIGRALVRKPAVYLMDEPLSSLDAKLREELRIELKRIQLDLGATILYVTHDQIEAMTLADRIGVLAPASWCRSAARARSMRRRPTSTSQGAWARRRSTCCRPARSATIAAPAGAATIGIRPEDLRLAARAARRRARLTVEHLGAETVALLEIAAGEVHVLLGAADRSSRASRPRCARRPGAALFFDDAGARGSARRRVAARKESAYAT